MYCNHCCKPKTQHHTGCYNKSKLHPSQTQCRIIHLVEDVDAAIQTLVSLAHTWLGVQVCFQFKQGGNLNIRKNGWDCHFFWGGGFFGATWMSLKKQTEDSCVRNNLAMSQFENMVFSPWILVSWHSSRQFNFWYHISHRHSCQNYAINKAVCY